MISVAVNGMIILLAGQVALFLGRRPGWQQFQRWLMATVLAGMAVKIALRPENKRVDRVNRCQPSPLLANLAL